ncbi:rhomboid family intramembrane serine protease [Nocardioides zeicaulis]|uniref:Rhomboid family intramembrane serine protease n=1 Tax=Nocardioides zeicaulis TaxID=1776857 RepID=A0ABV6E1E0_9ACTN
MTQPSDGQPATGVPTCYRHPGRETWIRCQRCERPICPDCMRDAAVGFQCPHCVEEAQRSSRQNRALHGGRRSGDPRLTSFVLIGINVVVWLAITATGGRSSRLGDVLALMPGGRCLSAGSPGQWYPSVRDAAVCSGATGGDGSWVDGVSTGAWWQLLTSAFTHVEVLHLVMNMLALYVLGTATEQILGRARFLAVYLTSALGGSVAVMMFAGPASSTVGASGALFGLLGALLVTLLKARMNTQWITQNIAIGVAITVLGWRYISWQAHLGGLVVGALCAAVIAYAPRRNREAYQWAGTALLVVGLGVLTLVRVAALG